MKNRNLKLNKKTGASLLLIVFMFGVALTKVNAQTVNPADTWQQAQTVTSFPFNATLNATSIPLNNDYNLPPANIPDGPDVVYKLVFTQDSYLNASVTSGENGKVALYREGFSGQDGPGLDNAYLGPESTGVSEWLHYDNDAYSFRGTEKWAIVFTPTQLAAYNDCQLTRIALFDSQFNHNTYTVKIYEGGTTPLGGTLKRTLTVQPNSNNAYQYLDLSNVLPVNPDQNLWIEVECTVSDSYPAAFSTGNSDPNGRWYYNENTGWRELTQVPTAGWKIRAFVTNQSGRTMPLGGNRDAGDIENMTVTPGTYYLVASSTSNQFSLSIDAGAAPCPEPATLPQPTHAATEVNPESVALSWTFGAGTTAYRLRFGTTSACENVLVNWTTGLLDNYLLTNLNNNTQYYWCVDERNGNCQQGTSGTVWSFTTHLNIPQLSVTNPHQFVGDSFTLSWTTPSSRSLLSYNLYQNDVLIANTTSNSHTVSGLAYNMSGYRFNVTAVYAEGESNYSNNCVVYVSGQGSVEGTAYDQDGLTPVANATITLDGHDQFGAARTYSLSADANGHYSGNVLAGTYSAYADATGYQTTSYHNASGANTLGIAYSQTTSNINFNMDEVFQPVASVTAAYYPNASNPQSARVTWTGNTAKSGDRSFHHYRVYRTEAYNFGPYTSDNTVMLADNLYGHVYLDATFSDLTTGSYKYGVSCVYAGNRDGRESEIVWSNILDVDMYVSGVSFSVSLGNDNPEGTVVSFVNVDENEQTYFPQPDIVMGSTGQYTSNHFRRGTYQVTVSKSGYTSVTETQTIQGPVALSYTLTEIILGVSRLYVSSTGWAKWENTDGNARGDRQFNHSEVVLTTTGNSTLYSGTTTNNHIQLPETGLTAGTTYRLKVRNSFTSATSAWATVDWVYQPSSGFSGASNLSGTTAATGNQLTWTYPAGAKGSRVVTDDRGSQAYCICIYGNFDNESDIWSNGLLKFNLSAPSNFTMLDATTPVFSDYNSSGLDYCPVDGYYYTYNKNKIYKIDLNSYQVVGSVATSGVFLDGAWDPTTNTMFAIYYKKLYRIDLNTGDYTLVGNMGVDMIALACDADGQLFAIESNNNTGAKLYRVNKNNATVTANGSTGLKTTYAQSAAFDHETGYLYWAHCNESSENVFRVTVSAGSMTKTRLNSGYSTGEAVGLYIPNHNTSVIGALVFRDGEVVGFTSDNTFTDAGELGAHEYSVRVVYGGAALCPNYNAFYSMSPAQSVTVEGLPHQASQLASGWNWWSTYIEQSGINGLEMLENSLGETGIRVQSRNQYTDYYDTYGWWGTLNAINNEQSYRIRTAADCQAVIMGQDAAPADHPITISNGWNWIGFPSAQSLSVTTAISGFTPAMNDQIKGRHQYTTYYGNNIWYGTLNTLEPGQGYMYKSNATTSKTLVYQTGRDAELVPNITTEGNIHQPESAEYADNMTITAVIELDGEELRSEAYELAAFVGDECRGSVKLKYVEPIDRYVAFLLVYGDVEEDLSFVLTDGEKALWANENVTYTANAIVGKATEPYVLRFGDATGMDEAALSLRVYPNPVACGERFSLGMNAAEGTVRVEVVNALGAVLSSERLSTMPASIAAPEVPGVYTLKILVDDKTVVCRKLVVR